MRKLLMSIAMLLATAAFTSCGNDEIEPSGNNNGDGNDSEMLLKGTFVVNSAGKKVRFTKGNLYWDGSAYHFEKEQTDYPTEWDAKHVGHFYWTSYSEYYVTSDDFRPYNEWYNSMSKWEGDELFCCESYPLKVDGLSGCFALSGDEWHWLISVRNDAHRLKKSGVTIDGKLNCMVIAPDDFEGELKESYTLSEANSLGLVCLPAAGYRMNMELYDTEFVCGYWTNDNNEQYRARTVYSRPSLIILASLDRFLGHSLRLVQLVK